MIHKRSGIDPGGGGGGSRGPAPFHLITHMVCCFFIACRFSEQLLADMTFSMSSIMQFTESTYELNKLPLNMMNLFLLTQKIKVELPCTYNVNLDGESNY